MESKKNYDGTNDHFCSMEIGKIGTCVDFINQGLNAKRSILVQFLTDQTNHLQNVAFILQPLNYDSVIFF